MLHFSGTVSQVGNGKAKTNKDQVKAQLSGQARCLTPGRLLVEGADRK